MTRYTLNTRTYIKRRRLFQTIAILARIDLGPQLAKRLARLIDDFFRMRQKERSPVHATRISNRRHRLARARRMVQKPYRLVILPHEL